MPNAIHLEVVFVKHTLFNYHLWLYKTRVSLPNYAEKRKKTQSQSFLFWVIHKSACFVSAVSVCQHRLGEVKFASKVLWCCIQQPVSIHQTQVSHVAAGCVQQFIEDHIGRLCLEEDGGRVDSYRLMGIQS